MSWHSFKKGHDYLLDYVVAIIDRNIKSGKVVEKERKSEYWRQIRDSGHPLILYSPTGKAGVIRLCTRATGRHQMATQLVKRNMCRKAEEGERCHVS
jgi:hypothetical protein